MALMQIGEVAARVGLSLRTLRHWDEVGLVVPSGRSVGGFRLYSEADVERLTFIKTLRPLELTLEQILDLLTTMDAVNTDDGSDHAHAEELRDRLAVYREAADARIEALRSQVFELETLSRELRRLSAPRQDQR